MIEFKILKLNDNGNLVIKIKVIDSKWYKDVYLDKLIIFNQDTFNTNFDKDKANVVFDIDKNTKEYIAEIPNKNTYNINLDKNILFIVATATGTPSSDVPCGLDNIRTIKTFVNLNKLYYSAMNYVKELANICSVSYNFIDFILKFNALKLAIENNDYLLAIKYWKQFFMDIKNNMITSCGCNK